MYTRDGINPPYSGGVNKSLKEQENLQPGVEVVEGWQCWMEPWAVSLWEGQKCWPVSAQTHQ